MEDASGGVILLLGHKFSPSMTDYRTVCPKVKVNVASIN